MPSFTDYQEVDVDVEMDISVSEFYEEMDDADCKEMARLLRKDGYLGEGLSSNSTNWEFEEAIAKLKKHYYSLTNEETNQIINIAKRF